LNAFVRRHDGGTREQHWPNKPAQHREKLRALVIEASERKLFAPIGLRPEGVTEVRRFDSADCTQPARGHIGQKPLQIVDDRQFSSSNLGFFDEIFTFLERHRKRRFDQHVPALRQGLGCQSELR
jgi:hypothetical protein